MQVCDAGRAKIFSYHLLTCTFPFPATSTSTRTSTQTCTSTWTNDDEAIPCDDKPVRCTRRFCFDRDPLTCTSTPVLDHERLDVYRCALEFLALAMRLADRLPPGNAALGDQLRRAATSIPLNVAEAVGKTGRADKRRFFAIARGSTMECAAIIDVLSIISSQQANDAQRAKVLLERCAAMLSKLARL
jgi:four helix bundle protein